MNLILLDDHELFGSVLKRALLQEDGIEEVVFVHTEQELRESFATMEAPILLLDINLRVVGIDDSFLFAKKLLIEDSTLRIVFLSAYNLPVYRKISMEIGAKGFFSKDISLKDLSKGLHIVNNGGKVFGRIEGEIFESLTLAETKVLRLAAKGMSRNEIANYLHISNRTVGRHLGNIFEKLGVRSITEAIVVSLEKGYIPPLV